MYTHASLRVLIRPCAYYYDTIGIEQVGLARGQVSCRNQSNQEQSNHARSSQEQSNQSHPTALMSPQSVTAHTSNQSHPTATRSYPRGSSPQQRGSTERQLHRL